MLSLIEAIILACRNIKFQEIFLAWKFWWKFQWSFNELQYLSSSSND